MFNYSAIKTLHIEVTDKCNASCPQCARNQSGGRVNQYLPLVELSLTDIKKMIPLDFINQLDAMYLCGNFGDPIMAKDTLEIFDYFRNSNPLIKLSMNTNGSARDVDWWKQLGPIIKNQGSVKFGIDGLQNTHSLYRKGTDFSKIIRNAKSFIDSGGSAVWEYIVFKHNEHQVAEARALSEQLGFKKFVLKKTGRFFSNSKLEKKTFHDVLNENNEPIYQIEPPSNLNYHNQSLAREEEILGQFGSFLRYFDQTNIHCKSIKENSLYISSEGLVFPCCWTANQMYVWHLPKESTQIWKHISKHGGVNDLCAKFFSIQNIIEGPLFKSIQESWTCKSIEQGKLQVCAKTCGTSFDQFKDQYQ